MLAGQRTETGSCGRTKVAGSTTGSGRRSRPPKAGRSSSPSTGTISGTAAALESVRTGSAGPGEWTPPASTVKRLPRLDVDRKRSSSSSVCPVRQTLSPNRDKRGRNGGERPVRSWQSGGGALNRGGGPPPSSVHPSVHLSSGQRNYPTRPAPPRGRPSHLNQTPPQPHYRDNLSNASPGRTRDRPDPKAPSEPLDRDRAVGRGRDAPPVLPENSRGGPGERQLPPTTATPSLSESGSAKPASQRHQEQRGGERSGSAASSEPSPQPSAATWEASSPVERPVERKSYSLARRTRSRPADLGSKQPSVEDSAACGASSPSNTGGKGWSGASEAPLQASGGGALTELEQDVARISLAGQAWSQSPASYIRSEMRGELRLCAVGAPPQL